MNFFRKITLYPIVIVILFAATYGTKIHCAAEPVESKLRRSLESMIRVFDLQYEYLTALDNYLPQIPYHERLAIINFLRRHQHSQAPIEVTEITEEAVERFEQTPEIVGMIERLKRIEANEPQYITFEDLPHEMKANSEIRNMIFNLGIKERVVDDLFISIMATHSQP